MTLTGLGGLLPAKVFSPKTNNVKPANFKIMPATAGEGADMKVIIKTPGEKPEIKDIENNLETLQKIVGGVCFVRRRKIIVKNSCN